MSKEQALAPMRHRMQSGFELIISVAIMFFIFTILLIVYFDRNESIRDYTETLEMRRMAYDLARHISAVISSGNGTNTTLLLYARLSNGKQVCYYFVSGRVEVEVDQVTAIGKSVSVPLATQAMAPTTYCLLSNGYRTFSNLNGFIHQ